MSGTNLVGYILKNAKRNDPLSVINTIDNYCKTHWMMNVGDVKGLILDGEVIKKNPQNVLEIGTFCGYSAIRIAYLLPPTGHLYTLEISPEKMHIAQWIIDYSGLSKKITIINSNLENYIKKSTKKIIFDLIFIDHNKTQYLSDLMLIEQAALISTGSVIVADNILYPGAPDYKKYVMTNNMYTSICHSTWLEYTNDIKDEMCVSIRR